MFFILWKEWYVKLFMKLKSMTTLMIKVTLEYKWSYGFKSCLGQKNKCKFLMKVFEKYAPDKTDRLLI